MTGENPASKPERPKLGREDAIEAMQNVLNSVIGIIDSQSQEFDNAERQRVISSQDWLQKRLQIIYRGIHSDVRSSRIYPFIEWLADYPEMVEEVIEQRQPNTQELANLLDGIGSAVQRQMIDSKLLRQDVIDELLEFDVERRRAKSRDG